MGGIKKDEKRSRDKKKNGNAAEPVIRRTGTVPTVSKYGALGVLIAIAFVNMLISQEARNLLYNNIDETPYNDLGVLLGTSMYLASGESNPYFMNRVSAAADLYHHGRIRFILASGDHRHPSYNEPAGMKKALVELGVSESDIYLDDAGLSTIHSVLRTNRIYGRSSFTVISQKFQNERAIFIAHHFGLDAIGFNASDVEAVWGLRTTVREFLARVKAVLDLYLFRVDPEYLDDRVPVPRLPLPQ